MMKMKKRSQSKMNRKRNSRLSGVIALSMALSVLAAGCESANGDNNELPPMEELPVLTEETTETEPTDAVEITETTTETTTEATTTTESETEPETEATTTEETEETEETTTAYIAPAAEWSETKLSGTMYVTEDCYSREKALIGATTISRRYTGDAVEVVAITDTGYYKLAEGGFIHSDYLSDTKPVVTEATTTATTPAQTEPDPEDYPDDSPDEGFVTGAVATEPEQDETTARTTGSVEFYDPAFGNAGAAIETASYSKSPDSKYAFKQLSAEEQELYKTIMSNVKTLNPTVEIPSGMSKSQVTKIYAMVYDSEPELFWMGGNISVGNTFLTISFNTTDRKEIASMQKEIDSAASKILSNANGYSGTFSKLKVFYDTIVLQSEFSKSESGYNCSIYNGLTGKGELQCAGYAKTMQYLCDLAGIDCCVVRGSDSEDHTHAWNVVYCDNGYYNLDTTWGDPINSYGSDYIQYEFFLVPDAWIHNITHFHVGNMLRSNGEELNLYTPPACTKSSANYFNAYKKVYDSKESAEAALYAEFDKQIAAGKNVVELRVSDKSIYDSMMSDDAFRAYQKYAKGKSSNVDRIRRQSQYTKGVYVVHYDVDYN